MQIKSAKFVKSSTQVQDVPKSQLPEYAFIGRSNVGKSSLINLLTERKSLAKTSSTPGKTQLINHFIINDCWYLVDLPGYGYAKVSKKEKERWHRMIENYLLQRKTLACTFILVDSRHVPQKIDLEFIQWAGESSISLALVFTKIDKLSKTQLKSNLTQYRQVLSMTWEELPLFFETSATKRTGKNEILNYIESINVSILQSL